MARSVLLVDDEPNIVLSLEFLMKQAGYEVRVARDGEAALAAMVAASASCRSSAPIGRPAPSTTGMWRRPLRRMRATAR
ncbi:MAG: response regulator [Alphaproteobacteria bacterium]|nr:response regulator [Alphaproteobacteria bacterium]